MQIEHKIVELSYQETKTAESTQDVMNAYGSEGWTLVQWMADSGIMIFKREVTN